MRDYILQTKSLFISAGHSYRDPGTSGNGIHEADVVLEFRDLVAQYLYKRVKFDRDGAYGQNLPLSEAVEMAKMSDVAVEFHCNSFNGKATGVETLSRPKHHALGNNLCSVIADTLGIANRGAKPEGSGRHSRLAFVSDGGGIIVELFFIDNKNDLKRYQQNKLELARKVGTTLIQSISI